MKELALLSVTLSILAHEERRKNRSCWTRDWIGRRPALGFTTTLVQELENEDATEFRTMFRMDVSAFEELLQLVTPAIQKQDTQMRTSICPKDKLLVTLRYLATGVYYYSYTH